MPKIPLSTNKKNFYFKLTKFNVMPMKSINFPSKMYRNWRVRKRALEVLLIFHKGCYDIEIS